MRAIRGRASSIEADHAATRSLLEAVAETGEPAVRAWRPPAHVAFGPRDVKSEGYDRAVAAAAKRGYPAHERIVGGRAVAHTGGTLSFARVDPIPEGDRGIEARYEWTRDRLQEALDALGVPTETGEPDGAFCPGTHSLSAEGKLVGVAQRVGRDAALTAGVVVCREQVKLATILRPVYDALDIPFEPTSVGSLRTEGCRAPPDEVARAVESALVGDDDPRVESVDRFVS